jgi:cysteine desulfurase
MTAYFDNAATTHLCALAALALKQAEEEYGNPSSLHALGFSAYGLMTESRKKVAALLGIRDKKSELIFTGSGTESNNTAIFGTAYAKKQNQGKKIIISDSEHPSVHNAVYELQRRGFTVHEVKTRCGVIDAEEFAAAVDQNTFLASVMTVNNESGAVYDIAGLCAAAKRINKNVIFHTDATQALCKIPLYPEKLGVDLMTVSAHKIGGPKGVGALYISPEMIKTRSITPYLFGGGQEYGLRSGTENVPGIAAFGAAAEAAAAAAEENAAKVASLSDRICSALSALGLKLNLPEKDRVKHIISVTLPGIKSETMLHHLSSLGVYVSSGSACSSHHAGLSRPMKNFGLTDAEADCTLRISLCPDNTEEEADLLISGIADGLKSLIRAYKIKII